MAGESSHEVTVKGRKSVEMDGVKHVHHYDPEKIVLETVMGGLILEGENFNISQLNLEDGRLLVQGYVHRLSYVDEIKGSGRKGNLWQRLVK